MSARRKPHFNVAPRYTCGSPAQVPQALALRVAAQEKEAYERSLTGIYGEADQALAEQKGLAGIAEERLETAKGWQVRDLCTGEVFLRPFAWKTREKSELTRF